ncbi:MAG TPA: hypothetical protein DC024_07355 [Clostridiales bacterium]|jgi:hypothetical protein|nr:hypothetical protein [Clostridiales bacterium]
MLKRVFIAVILFFLSISVTIGQNILIDDFENGYSKWTFEGDDDTFGTFPAEGNSRYQISIKGYSGNGSLIHPFIQEMPPSGKWY